jgi:hypothetical protein
MRAFIFDEAGMPIDGWRLTDRVSRSATSPAD